jgi:hypothetical protein
LDCSSTSAKTALKMRIEMNGVPSVHPDTGVQRVGDRLLAASPDDQLHTFEDEAGRASEVAERIVELSDGRRTLGELVEALCAEFEVEPALCAEETLKFVELLVERKVLSWARGPGQGQG